MQRRFGLRAAALGLAAFVVYLATANLTGVTVNDVAASSESSWALGQHRTFDVSGWSGSATYWPVFRDGHIYTNRFPGMAIAGAPFYSALGVTGAPTTFPGAVAAATWTAALVTCTFLLLTRLARPQVALLGALTLGLATPTWTVSADGMWPHGLTQLSAVLCLLALSKDRALLAGLPLGYGVLCRPHLGVATAVLAAYWLVSRRSVRSAFLLCAGSAVGTASLVTINHHLYGGWSVLGGYDPSHLRAQGVGLAEVPINVLGALVSPYRGVFVVTPFLLLLLPGIPAAWRRAPHWARASALAGLSYEASQLYLIRFSGGDGFFGYRIQLELLTFSAPLLLLSYREWTDRTLERRAAFGVLVGLSVGYMGVAAVLSDRWQPHIADPWRTVNGGALLGDISGYALAVWAASIIAGAVIGGLLLARHPLGQEESPTPLTDLDEPLTTYGESQREGQSLGDAVEVSARIASLARLDDRPESNKPRVAEAR
jgi:hypothetical protein